MFALNAALLAVSIASLGLPGPANAVALPVRRDQPTARLASLPLRNRRREGFKPAKRAIGESRRSQFLKSKKRQHDAQACASESRRATEPNLADGQPGRVDVTSVANNGTQCVDGHLFANMTGNEAPYTLQASPNQVTPLTLLTYNDTHALLCTTDSDDSDNDILCATYDTQPVTPEPLQLSAWIDPTTNDGSLSQMFAYNETSGVVQPMFSKNSDDQANDLDRRQQQPIASATLKFVPASPTVAAEAFVASSAASESATSSVASSSSASVADQAVASSSVSVTTTTVYLSSSSSAGPTPIAEQASVSTSAPVSTTTVTVYSSMPLSSSSAFDAQAAASSSASSSASVSSSATPTGAAPVTSSAALSSASASVSSGVSAGGPGGSSSLSSAAQPSVAVQPEEVAEAVFVGGAAPEPQAQEAYAPLW